VGTYSLILLRDYAPYKPNPSFLTPNSSLSKPYLIKLFELERFN